MMHSLAGLVDPEGCRTAAGELCFLHLDPEGNVEAMCGKRREDGMLRQWASTAEFGADGEGV